MYTRSFYGQNRVRCFFFSLFNIFHAIRITVEKNERFTFPEHRGVPTRRYTYYVIYSFHGEYFCCCLFGKEFIIRIIRNDIRSKSKRRDAEKDNSHACRRNPPLEFLV